MSGWFIAVLIFAVLAVIAFIAGRVVEDPEDVSAMNLSTAGLAAVAVVLTFVASFTIVPPREEGVVVSFGKVTGQLSSGSHLIKPWATVELFDASLQTLKREGNAKNDNTPCITVRLGNNTQACADVTLQWRLDPKGNVKELYKMYRTFSNISDNLVSRQLVAAMTEAYANYDPMAVMKTDGPKQPTQVELAATAKNTLQNLLGKSIIVQSLISPVVHYDADTENRLKAYQQEVANTRIAEQKQKTAEATRVANEILARSTASSDPGVMYQNCLNLVAELAAKGVLKDLPPTFTCGGSVSASTLVDGTKR